MKRNTKALSENTYDLLIVGGGIQGACVALEASRAGMKVALVERSDFGGATSANSLKILHGGLRYLQHLDFRRMVSSIQSRRFFAGFAPHLVKPLPCVIPTEKFSIKNPLPMWVALKLNDWMSFYRNRGLTESVRLPNGKLLSRSKCRELFPLISEPFEVGGACWYDYLILNSERLTLECLHEAAANGACVANYVEVQDYLIEGDCVSGIRARDCESDKDFEIRAKTTLNTVGPWWNERLSSLPKGEVESLRFAKAINLVIGKALLRDHSVGLEYRDPENGEEKRFFFLVPWQGGTIIGTTYRPMDAVDPNHVRIEESEVTSILAAVQSWFPDVKLSVSDVAFSHVGLLPIDLEKRRKGEGYRLHEDTTIVSHESTHGLKGFYSIKTVKYTTSPVVAAKFVKLLGGSVSSDKAPPGTRSSDTKACGETSEKKDKEWIDQLHERYGDKSELILQIISDNPHAEEIVCPVKPSKIAEVLYFVREEMACHLVDIVFRRGAVSGTRPPTLACLKRIAEVAGRELGWDSIKLQDEINEVVEIYRSRGVTLEEN